MLKALKYIFIIATLFAAYACERELMPGGDNPSGSGSIVLNLSSDDGVTLKTKDAADDDLADGLRYNNVLVVLTDNNGIVVAKSYDSSLSKVATSDIVFNNILPGNYMAYAYANIDRTVWQDGTISGNEGSININDNFNTFFLDRELKQLGVTPADPKEMPGEVTTAMLLTGKKAISVGGEVVRDTIKLKRPVVRLKVTVINNTSYPLKVNDMNFSHISPDRAYLIEHTDANGLPVVPVGTQYRKLPAYSSMYPSGVTVAAENDGEVYRTYIYENASPNAYKIFANMTLLRSQVNVEEEDINLKIGGRSFDFINKATLDAMDEGESVDVLIFNPQKNVRSGRLYCHISSNNNIAWESAGYDQFVDLVDRAWYIYNERTGTDCYPYTRYNPNNASHGFSSWDGLSADGSKATSFDYASARTNGKFFRTITKSNGKFTIDGLSVNPAGGSTTIPDLTVETGVFKSDKHTPGVGPYLLRFKNTDNQYLTSDVNWGSNGQTPHKVSYLKFQALGENQDRQFVLFGEYIAGSLLNRIRKDNHREIPLTYMSRNEDINVVINIYYANQPGDISFIVSDKILVDDTHWTTPASSSHIFN